MKKQSSEEMIKGIMEHFDFEIVLKTMNHLNWKWGIHDEPKVPDLDLAKKVALELLNEVVESIIKKNIPPDIPYSYATGGFKATAFKTKKGNISDLRLEFVLSGWEEERKIYE